MDGPPSDFRLLRFWSDDYPVHVRLAAWREVLSRKLLRTEVEPLPDTTFQVDASLRILADLRFGIGLFGPTINRRTAAIVQADPRDYYFAINLEGPFEVHRGGMTESLGEGDACFMSCAQESTFTRPKAGRLLCVRFRTEPLAALVPGLDELSGLIIRREIEPLCMLANYLRGLDDSQPLQTLETRRLVCSQAVDIAAAVLNAARKEAPSYRLRSLGDLRLRAIKTYVSDHLHEQELSIAGIASTYGLSPRHIQRFFKTEGTTFSEFVLVRRLQKVYSGLCDVRQVDRSVSELAFAAGFGDISHFNRAFRAHYGAAPTEVRLKIATQQAQTA